MHEADGVADMGRKARGVLVKVGPGDVVKRKGQAVVDLCQDEVFLLQHDVELLAEDLRVEQVLGAQPDTSGLVRIGGRSRVWSCRGGSYRGNAR